MAKLFRWLLIAAAQGGPRWMRARVRILLGKKAELSTAPATELAADSTIHTATSAPLRAQPIGELAADKGVATAVTAEITAAPAAEMVARKGVAVRVRAALEACRRAECVFVRRLFFGVRAGLDAAPAAEMACTERIRTATSAPAIAADSTELESTTQIVQATRAAAQAAPAEIIAGANCGVAMSTKAQIGTSVAVGVNINSLIPVRTTARLSTAFAVDFCNEDGAELHTIPVKSGQNAYDPVAAGELDAPSREDDVQYHYGAFTGWSRVNGGDANENALLNITEPTTLYAAWEKTLRKYTIRFYDDDSTTLLHSVEVNYGEMPEYTPEKDGFDFVGWTPALVPVAGDASYFARWEEAIVTFADASWAKIAAISESGKAADYFAVGDTKTIAYTNEDGTTTDMDVVIIGFNHDDLSDGSGKAGMTLACLSDDLPETNYGYSKSRMYANSYVHTLLNETVKNALPTDLQSVIKKVTKKIDGIANSSSSTHKNTATMDTNLFAFSIREVGYSVSSSNTTYPVILGTKYSYFSSFTAAIWKGVWTRNHRHAMDYCFPVYGSSSGFTWVNMYSSSADTVYNRVKFGFCI